MVRKKIAYDLDGVIYDFIQSLDDHMRSEGFKIYPGAYNIGKRYGTDNETGYAQLSKLRSKGLFRWSPLILEARKQMMKDSKNAEIFIVTARDPRGVGKRHTLERISNDALPVKKKNIFFDKNKGRLASDLGIDLFYEDSLANAYEILEGSYSKVTIVDADYNQTTDPRLGRVKW